jgi:hypothetical protein
MLSFIFIALIIAGAIGYVTRDRNGTGHRNDGSDNQGYNPGYPETGYSTAGYTRAGYPGSPDQDAGHQDAGYGTPDRGPQSARTGPARADADHWIGLLGAGLTSLDGAASDDETAQRAARFALSDAAERHTAATTQLARAQSVHEIELASRTALEGLHYLRAARTALGLDPGPDIPASSSTGALAGTRRVVVHGTEYEASDQPGQRTPYYYPGGNIRGRSVPAGWYSTPWWKTALVAGAAGMGSLLVMDTLFGHHGGFGGHLGGGPGGMGGMGGGPMDHIGAMGAGGDGGGFLDGGWF